MKVLLDENIPHDLRPFLRHHDTFTAAYLGWAGLKNGALLEAAENDGFDVLVTGDLSLPYQQNMEGRRLAIVSLSAVNWPVIEPVHGELTGSSGYRGLVQASTVPPPPVRTETSW